MQPVGNPFFDLYCTAVPREAQTEMRVVVEPCPTNPRYWIALASTFESEFGPHHVFLGISIRFGIRRLPSSARRRVYIMGKGRREEGWRLSHGKRTGPLSLTSYVPILSPIRLRLAAHQACLFLEPDNALDRLGQHCSDFFLSTCILVLRRFFFLSSAAAPFWYWYSHAYGSLVK